MKLYENKISVEVSKEDWDKLEDDALAEIDDTIDTIICEAIDRITDLLDDLSAEKNVKLTLFSN